MTIRTPTWTLVVACLACLACLAAAGPAAAADVPGYNDEQYARHFKEAEARLVKFQFVEAVQACNQALKYKPADHLARAFICLCLYEIAEDMDLRKAGVKERKYRLYGLMKKIANEGIAHAPDRGECHFFRGLAVGRMATTDGILSSLVTASSIEKDWLKAAASESSYTTPTGENLRASSYVALGAFYRLCPDFFLIKISFGIQGDMEKSVSYLRKAYALDPTRIEIVKELGIGLVTRGQSAKRPAEIAEGRALLERVAALPIKLKSDYIDKEHSKMLLADLSLCSGYSRDQQQDVSEETYKKIEAMRKQQREGR